MKMSEEGKIKGNYNKKLESHGSYAYNSDDVFEQTIKFPARLFLLLYFQAKFWVWSILPKVVKTSKFSI